MIVWKFDLNLYGRQFVQVPKGSQILHVQAEFGQPKVWVLCEENEAISDAISIRIYRSGRAMPGYPGRHISTFQVGDSLFHAFEE